jgi:anti-sigma B factor antagonist
MRASCGRAAGRLRTGWSTPTGGQDPARDRPDLRSPGNIREMAKDTTIRYQPSDDDGLTSAVLSGELDLDRADQIRDDLARAAAEPGCRWLRVDVSELSFIDSYGLGALVSARNSAAASGAVLTLIQPSPPVRKAIEVTGLADVFGL